MQRTHRSYKLVVRHVRYGRPLDDAKPLCNLKRHRTRSTAHYLAAPRPQKLQSVVSYMHIFRIVLMRQIWRSNISSKNKMESLKKLKTKRGGQIISEMLTKTAPPSPCRWQLQTT